ncbi:MAG: SDR family oxidoreductase [Thermodesulfobacteriota bacterium]
MERQKERALVTGASSGIGRETAIKLVKKGFQVIAAARRVDRLTDLANQFQGIIPKQVDFSNTKDIKKFCDYISNLPYPVSILINNAGYSIRGMLEDVSIEAIKHLFEVNLFALIRITQSCLPGMRKLRKGTIVNLSSIAGKFAFPGNGVYAASKYAVEGITDALRLELAPFGIKVVAIRPGPIATEFNEVDNKLTGDLMARTDPDYKPIYQTAGAATKKLFTDLPLPGPDLIADFIVQAVLSDTPKAVYSAGPLSENFLGKRARFNDDEFHRFMLETFDLTGLKP